MSLLTVFLIVIHILGALSALNALMNTRTSQGTVAWIICLLTIPYVALPAYWIFGRSHFHGYVKKRRAIGESHDTQIEELRQHLLSWRTEDLERNQPRWRLLENLAELPFFRGNSVSLLVDGVATFESILGGIQGAKDSVHVQFYIVRDDGLGRRLQKALIQAAERGVRVHFIFDEIGSAGLPNLYLEQLREAGVFLTSFHSTRGPRNRFQLNFRNHRKIVVVDRQEAWLGGHNVGDEYLGLDPKFGAWRDTHMKLTGPAVTSLLVSFAEDWLWATDQKLQAKDWTPALPAKEAPGDANVLILPTGPADRLETASLMYQQAIQSARRRIWITSPYFVPDQAVLHTLHLAALSGVDVRIVIPDRADSPLVYYSAFQYIEELMASGVKFYRYLPGFLHEKVFLLDDQTAGVGTANFDNRSFRLNFEVTAIVVDADFAQQVEEMLLSDFAHSHLMTSTEVEARSHWSRLATRASYLIAPIQ
ncbi:MAG: cardiolipin synthase [Polyangiaceae bacterium]|nr:cardiolipin synthase [Polyangiaceae bacterium]